MYVDNIFRGGFEPIISPLTVLYTVLLSDLGYVGCLIITIASLLQSMSEKEF